jgi:hypothetical protein
LPPSSGIKSLPSKEPAKFVLKMEAARFSEMSMNYRTARRHILEDSIVHNHRCELVSHRGSSGSKPGLVMWDLWWTKWRWGRFSPSTSVSPANLYYTIFSTVTITYHLGLVQ